MARRTNKKAPPVAPGEGLQKQLSTAKTTDMSSTTVAQYRRMLAALKRRPHTTDDFRKLGIFQCSARIWGLRATGYVIETTLTTVVDRDGFAHPRAALYSLVSEPEGVQ